MVKKTLRIPDPRDCVKSLPAKFVCEGFELGSREVEKAVTREPHRKLRRAGNAIKQTAIVDDDGIRESKPRHRLAQRSRGKHETVAKPALAIDHDNLDIPCKCVVLESVVADQHVAVWMPAQQGLRNPGAIMAYPNRYATF